MWLKYLSAALPIIVEVLNAVQTAQAQKQSK